MPLLQLIGCGRTVVPLADTCPFCPPRSSPSTYVMEEDEPSFLEPIDYSAESNDEDGELENEPGSEAHENPDHHDPLFDPETSHRARR